MSIGSDSRVVDALHEGANLRRVLEALGCDVSKDNGSPFDSPGGYIHCPMPHHPDRNPSVTVRAAQGQFYCQSVCGPILPLDLIVEHGRAKDRAEAAKWVEDLLGMQPEKVGPARPLVDDPSLTVAAYLARKGLPEWIADKFGLQDVMAWHPGAEKGTKDCSYESGWYASVLMPTRPGRRSRIRSDWPRSAIRWATKVRQVGSALSVDTALDAEGRALELDVIGLAHLEPTIAGAPNVLVVVEGESDTHALHAMGLPCCVGVPGSKNGERLKAELLEACIAAGEGDTDLSSLTVVVWMEPGSAGGAFPKHVAGAIRDACDEAGFRAPRFSTLAYTKLPGHPKDPATLLMDRPLTVAREQMESAILGCLSTATVAAEVAVPAAPSPAQSALDVLQVDGEHTPPPQTVSLAPPVEPELPATLPPGWSAESNAAPLPAAPAPALPAYMEGPAPRRAGMAAPLWESFTELEDPPAEDLAPERVEGVGCQFVRTDEGWAIEKRSADGDTELKSICTAFVVEQVERCSGEILVRVAAPFGGAWNRTRLSMGTTADAGRTCAALGNVGVVVANRQRPAVTDLLLALTMRAEQEMGAVHVPAGTGWSGKCGTSMFGGIEVEPVNDFGARMFEANERRREMRPDTRAAAVEWMRLAAKLVSAPSGPPVASHAAPLLAIGAAAAAPLVGPLADVGVAVAPVVWIAGLGGGGKSITQKLCASIFAPALPDLDGQSAFFANANISQAALSARVDSCRDLPLELDDVTQLPPLPGSTSRGDAARIEAAAALGMMVFNRKPIERATRDGGIRQTRAFRSSAIFSAEVSMSSEASKAIVTAGHRRRISTIEARPMTERGLSQDYAEAVNHVAATVGGAPGELLVAKIREVVADRDLRRRFDQVRDRIVALDEATDVTMTQRESLAVIVLGFELLCEAISGRDMGGEPVDLAIELLRPYLATGAGAGGATRDSDLGGVDSALRAVADLQAAHPLRFDHQVREESGLAPMAPTAGYLGKEISRLYDGSRRVVLLRAGMSLLNSQYGVTQQVIEQAIAEGCCKARHQFRMNGERVTGVLWILPPSEPDEPDFDPTAPVHDPDPHGLADTSPIGEDSPATEDSPRVPGMGAWLDTDRSPSDDATPNGHTDPAERSHDDLERWIAEGWETVVNYHEGDIVMDARFGWGSGLYKVGDGPACRENQSVLTMVRREARQELEALQMQYRHAHEKDVETWAEGDQASPPPVPVDVAPFPADDSPNWERIDALGRDVARAQWAVINEALHRANHSTDPAAKHQAHVEHVKAYRVHLMARYRRPEWFVEGTQSGRA